MLLRQMKYLVAVIECNSFTKAAEQCYISQSAVSQQIRALENELGVELIHRENRGFTVTAAGEYFYAQCRSVLDQLETIVRETKRLGKGAELQLRIGYLKSYSGMELQRAVAEFSKQYPEVSIHILNGTHEELYDLLRSGGADLVLSDQRRAFSDAYTNYELMRCGCYAELSSRNPLSAKNAVQLDELKKLPCILIVSHDQQDAEQEYYRNTLGFGGTYLFADDLEKGRLLVASNRGFLPVESVGTLPPEGSSIRRLPIYNGEKQIVRNYCVFWQKEKTNDYMIAFARVMQELLCHNDPADQNVNKWRV